MSVALRFVLFVIITLSALPNFAAGSVAFVQVNSAVPQTPQSTVTVTYTSAQTPGDLNVAVVGWNDSTAHINSVTDSKGNAYVLAIGPTVQSGTATQAIYYAKNITGAVANGNMVTVTFSVAASYPDVRIAEYSGLDPSVPVDVVAAAQGSGTPSNSGSVTTGNANDLLVGANLVQAVTTGAGLSYTSRTITNPDGDILEDSIVKAMGSYSATAPVSGGAWIMQMVAFQAAGTGVGTSPSITNVNPTSGIIGTSVAVTGTNFGSTQGTSTVTFNGTAATPMSWSATSIVVPVPAGATTGNLVVTVGGVTSNGVSFTVTSTAPSIISLNPTSGVIGTSVTVTGTNFGSTQGTSTVKFNGTVATPTSWSATSIVTPVPAGATTGNVVVTVGGVATNGVNFTVTSSAPSITALNPASGVIGTSVTATGTNFGSTQGTSTVTFNGTAATPTSWSATSIVVPVPAGATTGNVVVTVGGMATNGVNFTVTSSAPSITTLNPASGVIGTSVTATGTNFGSTQGTSTVTFNGTTATPTSWSATSIVVPVPAGATTGNVVVTVGGVASNGVNFAVGSVAPVAFVQVNSAVPQTPQSIVTVTYTSAQTPGDLNVAVVGWNDSTAHINSVTDSKGNAYVLAIGPTVQSGTATQAIYYAKNITGAVANGNMVTVTFSVAASYPDVRIAEYSGLDPSVPVDVVAAAQGSGTPSNSGSVTTGNANDLLVGANLVQAVTTGAGLSYTSRTITNPDGDILEDSIVKAMGSYSATAPVSGGAWIMQMVAFQAAGTGVGTSPSITNVNPTSGIIGTSVAVTGTNFGSTQGTSTVTFNGTAATPMSWSATSIVVPVPAGATTGNLVVTVGGVTSNGVSFTVTSTAPSIISLNPTSGVIGTSVTVTGTNFGSTQGTSTVKFNGTVATPTSWSATSIVTPVPAGATTGNVVVTVGGVATNGVNFTVTSSAPSITALNPASGVIGTSVTATGTNFGSTQGTSTVTFNGTAATPTSWSATSIVVPVPAGATTGNVVVTVGGMATNGVNFAVGSVAPVAFVQVNSAVPQTPQLTVTVTYTSAQTPGDLNVAVVGWNDSTAHINSVTDSKGNAYVLAIGPTVQSGTATQAIYYAKNITGAVANGNMVTVTFSVAASYPDVRIAEYSGLDPSVPVDVVAAAQGSGTPSNSGSVTTGNANDLLVGANLVQAVTTGAGLSYTSRTITNPDGDILEDSIVKAMGSYSATAPVSGGAWIMQMVAFQAAGTGVGTSPSITNVNPTSGIIGTSVAVTGTNFGSTQGTSTVKFNGTVATPTSWSATSIVVPVPAGATTGNLVVTVGGVASNGVSFTVTSTAPSIISLNPTSGIIGTSVTVTGTNFGSTQGTGAVTFNGTVATPTSWSATSIVTPVPAGATTGNVVVSVGGQATNGAAFIVTTTVAYPLKASPNQRYLVDQNNVPFLILGDSPQSMMANLSTSSMATYMANRQARGFNTIWIDALVTTYTGGNASGTTFDGIVPFTSGSSLSSYDLSTPNSAYFSRLDTLVSTAASYGLVVFLDPIETGGWLTTLENNGATKAFNYGAFLGNRYKNSPNIVWESGNDFQTWNTNSTDNNLVYQVMAGIASAAPNQVQTIELNFNESYSNQDTALNSVLGLDAVYTYYETYDETLAAYNSSTTLPIFLTEANYEYENNTHLFSGTTGAFILREQEYWAMTSGAYGQLYGNHYTWTFDSGWQNFLGSPGTLELAYWVELFNSVPWWNLVPDQTHQIVTSGYGTYNGSNGNLPIANYATTAWIPDGSLAIIYDPAGNALTVNLAKFSQPVTAAWYDPSDGEFNMIAGSPFANSGTQQFTPPGTNNDGDKDWVLIFEVTPTFP